MANAGRVAIVPKGEFEFGTPYKRLDLVRYEKNVYVAKKENISIFPTDESYWMFVMQLSEFQPDGTTILSDEHGILSVVTGKPNGVAGLDENGKIPMEQIPEWDTKDNITTFTSNDSLTPTAWGDVDLLESGERHSSILEKISTMFKNVRYIYKLLGTTDVSAIGNGTITGAIHSLNTDTLPTFQVYDCGFTIYRIGRIRIICSDYIDADAVRNTILDYRDRPATFTVMPVAICTGGWGTIFGDARFHTNGKITIAASASVGGAMGSYTDVTKLAFNAVFIAK